MILLLRSPWQVDMAFPAAVSGVVSLRWPIEPKMAPAAKGSHALEAAGRGSALHCSLSPHDFDAVIRAEFGSAGISPCPRALEHGLVTTRRDSRPHKSL